jgi:hypothetical protein
MFSHGADSSGVGVSAGGPTVPARFVWPHGGKRVLVTGTFTRFAIYLSPSTCLIYIISYLL